MRTSSKSQPGLSLIEAIVFILIISIGLTGVISVYLYTTRHSADAMLSLKTVELSQALMDEILSKGYDENTPVGGGCVGSGANTACNSSTSFSTFGIDAGESRSRFDDVDDYLNTAYCGDGVSTPDSLCAAGCSAVPAERFIDETEADISANYAGYSVCIQVSYAGTEINDFALLGSTTNTPATVPINDAKRIDLIIRDPLDARLTFTAYKANF